MPVAAESIVDLLKSTIPKIERGKRVNLMQTIQRYEAADLLFNENPNGKSLLATQYSWRYQTIAKPAYGAQLYSVISPTVPDTLSDATVPIIRNIQNDWSYDEHEEAGNGTDPEQILDLMETREAACDQGLADLIEQRFWGLTTLADSGTFPLGLCNLVTMTNATSTVGFNGGEANGWTSTQGISRASVSQTRNANGTYTNMDRPDFLEQFRYMTYLTDFRPPIQTRQLNGRSRYGIYSGYTAHAGLRRVAEGQGQALGFDLSGPEPMYNRIPIRIASQIDNSTLASMASSNPVYWINWIALFPVKLRGMCPARKIIPAPSQPWCATSIKQFTYNLCTLDPRSCGVLATAKFGD